MKHLDTRAAAREARAAQPNRPATALLHDVLAARLVIFRIAPGQAVPPHTSTSMVILTVLEGTGTVVGGTEERAVSVGDVIIYEPNELHGMRAADDTLVLLATITPRPGAR
jgi:quercetin dioxygenase-like cupin family protein